MYRISINDKEYSVPTAFSDITLGQYVKCFNGLIDTEKLDGIELFTAVRKNEATIISRLLGEDDDFCLNMPVVIYSELSNSCKFIYSLKTLGHSNEIVIDDVSYSVPQPDEFSLRQWIDVDVTMQEEGNESRYLDLLAILLMKRGDDGKFIPYGGIDKALRKRIEDLPADKGLGIVYHFFLRGEISRRITSISSKMGEVLNQFRQNIHNS